MEDILDDRRRRDGGRRSGKVSAAYDF